jgi:hypothetical protein
MEMYWYKLFSLSAVTALALPMLGGSALSQQELKDRVGGVWTVVSNESIAANGDKRQPFGTNPKGILILDAGGRYALVITKADRPKFHSGNRQEITIQEYASAAEGSVAQFGTWSIDETNKTLVRRVEGALLPNTEGSERSSVVSVAGDELKLTELSAPAQGGGTTIAVFHRAK